MSKVFIVAKREYRAMVATKAFLITIAIMPVFMVGGVVIHHLMEGRVGPEEKRIAVLDDTGKLFDKLAEAAAERNRHGIFDPDTGRRTKPRYRLEKVPAGKVTQRTRYELSERIRDGKLDSFVEIPAGVLEVRSSGKVPEVAFYAEGSILSPEKDWLRHVLSDLVATYRLEQAGLDPELVARARTPVPVKPLGLVERPEGGEAEQPDESSQMLTMMLPFGMMMLMWMVIFLSAQPMLESVLEEKSQRIAEVLLGSIHPFQLMSGKLLGGVAGSLTVVAIYAVGGCAVAEYFDVLDKLPLMRVVPWFIVYQVLAVLMFGSVFMAVGAAANNLKEAQSMLLPVWLLLVLPMMVWFHVVREPTSSFATWISLIPPATPMVMVLRTAASSMIPLWQQILGIVVQLVATLLCVFAAGRIFRIGILSQGQTPKLRELARWIVRG